MYSGFVFIRLNFIKFNINISLLLFLPESILKNLVLVAYFSLVTGTIIAKLMPFLSVLIIVMVSI